MSVDEYGWQAGVVDQFAVYDGKALCGNEFGGGTHFVLQVLFEEGGAFQDVVPEA